MKKNVITFLIVICFHSVWGSIPQDTTGTAGKLSIFGNVLFSSEVLQDRMGFVPGRPMPEGWPEKSLTNLASFYMEQGYYFIRIDSLRWRFSGDSFVVNAEMWIHEGEVLCIGEIVILGEDEKSYRKWLSGIESRPGSMFHDTILEQDIDHILVYYENIGYPLTRVEIQSLTVQGDDTGHPFIDIVLQIHKKSFVGIGDLRSEGQRQTLEKVILRESRLKTGQPYKQKKIDMAQKYLKRLEYFDTVEKPHIQFQGKKADVTFRVKEGRTNTIDGVIGYIPPKDDGQNGYVTGRLEFQFRNLLGTGRFVEAFWEKKDNYSQAMRFGYEEPWLLGWPVNLGGQFQQIIRDTTYIQRHWKFYLRYRPSPTLSVEMKGGQAEVLPDSIGSARFNLAHTESWLLSVGFDYSTFDDRVNPIRGVRYHTIITMGRKKNLGPDFLIENNDDFDEVLNTRLLQMDAEVVIPTWSHQVIYCGVHGTEVRTGETFIPISDQIRFGGSRTLRGYDEDAFRGSLAAWFNVEYRYILARHSRVFVFIDGGMYQRREEEEGFVKGTKLGYGFGIRIETQLGLIGIDYGIGEGDGLLKGKVHVGLVNSF